MAEVNTVITYVRGADRQLTANFKQAEFDCKGSAKTSRCGCKKTLISTKLVRKLQILRKKAGSAITINSGYRCSIHNFYSGGAGQSFHTKGFAADIRIKGMTPAKVAKLAEEIGFTGVGMYNGTSGVFTHVDVRPTPYKWKNTRGKNITVSDHGGTKKKRPYALQMAIIRLGSTGDGVRAIQWVLNWAGYPCTVDGDFGAATKAAVIAFQTDMCLTPDGIVGNATRSALSEVSA